jgi:hypothetical protein
MKNKTILPFCVVLILFLFYSMAFSGERPKGFRGLTWGTHISKVQGLTLVAEPGEGIKTYRRLSDKLEIGKGKVDGIVYVFKNQKLISVILFCKDYGQYLNLRSVFLDIYGPPDRVEDNKRIGIIEYYWYAKKDDEANVKLKWIEWTGFSEGFAVMNWKGALKKGIGL